MKKAAQHIKKNLSPSFSPQQRKIILALSLSFLILFGIFTLVVREDLLRSFDFDTTVRLQDDIPVRFDEFFSLLSVIGRFEFSIVVLGVILALRRKIFGILTIGFFGFAHVIEIIGKTFLSQPGPPHMFLRTTDLSMNFPGLHVHTDASYPSGHALRVIFIFIIIFLLLWKNKKIPALFRYSIVSFAGVYTILMLVSRVSLGEHWTTDVIGGALLGASFALLSLLLL